jgi:hypothetical protein
MVRPKCVVIEPPDPGAEKRSPASATTERGAYSKSKRPSKSLSKAIAKRTRRQASRVLSCTVYDGRDAIGRIKQVDNKFRAIAVPRSRALGLFRTVKAAADAISDAHGGEQ